MCFLNEIRSKRRDGEKRNEIFVKNLYTIEKRERIVIHRQNEGLYKTEGKTKRSEIQYEKEELGCSDTQIRIDNRQLTNCVYSSKT